METKKIARLGLFEETARNNGYELFTEEEIANYAKEGLMKSQKAEMTPEERDEFVADMMYIQKAICVDDEGKEVVRYYRKAQVNWESDIMKGIEGTYADTAENRRLNRVGHAFVPSAEILKAIEADEEMMKSIQEGAYADTEANKALNRVGQEFISKSLLSDLEK